MKLNRIKLFLAMAACVSVMAVGCKKSEEPQVTEEQAAENAEAEAEALKDMEGYDNANDPDNRKE